MKARFIIFFLTFNAAAQAMEWRCQKIFSFPLAKRLRVLKPADQTIELDEISSKLKFTHWGQVVGQGSTVAVEVNQISYPTRPNRNQVNEIVGWQTGRKKIVVVLREIDLWRLTPALNWTEAFVQRAVWAGLMADNDIGFGVSRYSYHWEINFIDENGRWTGSDTAGLFEPAETINRLPNHNVILVPIEESDGDKVDRMVNSIQSARGEMKLGCSNYTCQVLGAAELKPKKLYALTTRTALNQLVAQKLGTVKKILVLGTQLEAAGDLDWATYATDTKVIRESLRRQAAVAIIICAFWQAAYGVFSSLIGTP